MTQGGLDCKPDGQEERGIDIIHILEYTYFVKRIKLRSRTKTEQEDKN